MLPLKKSTEIPLFVIYRSGFIPMSQSGFLCKFMIIEGALCNQIKLKNSDRNKFLHKQSSAFFGRAEEILTLWSYFMSLNLRPMSCAKVLSVSVKVDFFPLYSPFSRDLTWSAQFEAFLWKLRNWKRIIEGLVNFLLFLDFFRAKSEGLIDAWRQPIFISLSFFPLSVLWLYTTRKRRLQERLDFPAGDKERSLM